MKTLNIGDLISDYRVLSVISQSGSEIIYSGYNLSNSTYVTIHEFYPRKLNIHRVGSDVLVDTEEQANFDRLADMFIKSADLCDDNNLLRINNTLYIVAPQIFDTTKSKEIFAYLEKIDKKYEIADSRRNSRNRLSALAEYEDVMKANHDLFYLHLESVNNLADCYFYNYSNDAKLVNSTSEYVQAYTQEMLNKKAFDLYIQSACRGSAYAQYQVGYFYDKGYGCLCNYQRAAYWYQEAYKNGYKDSAKRLGDFYFYGQGVEQSYKKAIEYFETAAEFDSEACLTLVKYYDKKTTIKTNNAKLYYYLNKAYELGNRTPDICIKLAECYITACGTDKNLKEADKLITKAALARDEKGVSNLINNVYLKKKIGHGNRIRCHLYKLLSYWDCLLMFLAFIVIALVMFAFGLI